MGSVCDPCKAHSIRRPCRFCSVFLCHAFYRTSCAFVLLTIQSKQFCSMIVWFGPIDGPTLSEKLCTTQNANDGCPTTLGWLSHEHSAVEQPFNSCRLATGRSVWQSSDTHLIPAFGRLSDGCNTACGAHLK